MFAGLLQVLRWESMTMSSSTLPAENNSVNQLQVSFIFYSGFQLIQEKIVKIMANTQAIFLLCFRVSKMIDDGKATMGQIAMTKAWVTERAREIARLGREIMGGNGITHENYVMKALADMEAIYTYEGTYDVNPLVAGR